MALQLLVDLCWSLATAFAKTLLHGVYLSDLSLNRQPIATHRKKWVFHVERWHLDKLQEFWCLSEFDPCKPALAALQLGSTLPGLMRGGQTS